jgi:hypothetical protein
MRPGSNPYATVSRENRPDFAAPGDLVGQRREEVCAEGDFPPDHAPRLIDPANGSDVYAAVVMTTALTIALLLAGGPPLQVTTDPSHKTQPAWSPDGAYIAFTVWSYEAQFWVLR